MSTRQLRSATKAKAAAASGALNLRQSKPTSAATVGLPVVVRAKKLKEEVDVSARPNIKKRPRVSGLEHDISKPKPAPSQPTATISGDDQSPKRQKLNKYPPGVTPFPDHPHPTPEEVQTVVDLLSSIHGVHMRPPKPPVPDLSVAGCGEVPSVLDALIRTLLSANTTAQNSNRAFQGLVEKFGVCGKGGSVDWSKVRKAASKEVTAAIRPGGLANIKSKRIQNILQQVWEEAQVKKGKRKGEECTKYDKRATEERGEGEEQGRNEEGQENAEGVATRKRDTTQVVKQEYHGHQLVRNQPKDNDIPSTVNVTYSDNDDSDDDLSLDYLHNLSDTDAMSKLTSFEGIGFKTASCVLLFCMSRESFAVDTHVFRIARFLNWVPPDKANRETAFWHLDARLPGAHKYALHQLFIKHGRTCKWCRAGGPLTYEKYLSKGTVVAKSVNNAKVKKENDSSASEMESDVDEVKLENIEESIIEKCPIEHLVKRFHRTRKGTAKSV